MQHSYPKLFLSLLTGAMLLSGCATNGERYDPLEPMNRGIYQFNDVVDKAVLKPVAQGYNAVVPDPVRTSVGNFFSNLDDLVVIANDLLQFKFHQAASDTTRLVFNSTFGILGLFDVATGWDLPKHDEDFGQTLGYWGIGNGPYLVLPILGPSTLRDTIGRSADSHVDPIWQHNDVPERNSAAGINLVDTRARLLKVEKVVDDAALDKYIFIREGYLQKRRSLVFDGNPPRENLEDYEDEPVKSEKAKPAEKTTSP